MRWPWRRKPRGHDASMAVDWSAFGEPDARFTKWMEHHRTHEPDCQYCAESCAEPENPQVSGNYSEIPNSSIDLPPCAPFPEHQHTEDPIGLCWACTSNTIAVMTHALLHDPLCPAEVSWDVIKRPALVLPEPETIPNPLTLDDLQDDALADILADATETITNPYGQEQAICAACGLLKILNHRGPIVVPPHTCKETTMTDFPLPGITLDSTVRQLAQSAHASGVTVRVSTSGGTLSDGAPHTINLDTDEQRPVHSPGWYRRLDAKFATEHFDFPALADIAAFTIPVNHTATDGSKWVLDRDGGAWDLTEYMDDDTHLLHGREKPWLEAARKVADPLNSQHTAIVYTGDATARMVITNEAHLRSQLEAEYQRGLREGRLDNSVVRAEVVGSPGWLRHLADDLDAARDFIHVNRSVDYLRQLLLRTADERERQAAADTRDRERVIGLFRQRGTTRYRDDGTAAVAPFDELSQEHQDAAIASALVMYRAGRDDQEADRG